jgi:hypothetical protein
MAGNISILAEETSEVNTNFVKVSGTDIGNKRALDVSILGGPGSLLQGVTYDYGSVTYPSGTQEVYTFKSGGAGGTTVKTITVNYVDATKEQLLNFSAS